jgi:hypothetical protein
MTIFAGLGGGWSGPMLEDRASPIPLGVFVLFVLVVGGLGFRYVVHRITDPGPLARGEARWRYRNRAVRERIVRAMTWLVPVDRSAGWWATRIEFAVAIGSIATTALLDAALPGFGGRTTLPAVSLGALAVMLVGLAWMIRIYRAPLRLDSKAYWRYHDGP